MSTDMRIDVQAVLEMVREFRAKDDLRKSQTYFAILGMEPCRECGHKIAFKEGPPETIVLCRHLLGHLKRQCEPATGNPMTCGAPPLFGWVVEIAE